ncbi:hypothetical protein Glove_460g14 [Diversispora epigaea]|uniref:Uncharacterized protein n=1 Tax=Diversispora epigaea TaxID=1348612 RepID=A0A397GQF9_9GLOM|nr:hypothetical protein Glove_460g14 [Diversispora epigaea]
MDLYFLGNAKMADDITVNFRIHDSNDDDVHTITIPRDTEVNTLQARIRNQLAPLFNHLHAEELDLRQVHPIINRHIQRGASVSVYLIPPANVINILVYPPNPPTERK